MAISPEVGVYSPPEMVKKVLFPEPEGPMMLTNSPCLTLKLIPFSAVTSVCPLPKVLTIFFIVKIFFIFYPPMAVIGSTFVIVRIEKTPPTTATTSKTPLYSNHCVQKIANGIALGKNKLVR